MTEERAESEQQENLELTAEPEARDEPAAWGDPDVVPDAEDEPPPEQFTAPGGGLPGDDEPTEIAEDQGVDRRAGPEHQAVRVEGEEGGGRVGS